jgi:hypothetical protein
MFRVPDEKRVRLGTMATDESAGNNGAFVLIGPRGLLDVIASDGMGWDHISVKPGARRGTPTWEEMTFAASQFWADDDVLVQFRPARKDYVNMHEQVLHWWRKQDGDHETPPSIMVGIK